MSNKLFLFIVVLLSSCIKRIDGPIDYEISAYKLYDVNLNYSFNPTSNLTEYVDKVYFSLADSSVVKSVKSNEWSIAFASNPASDRQVIMNYALGTTCNGFTLNDTNWTRIVTENTFATNTLKFANHYDTFANLMSSSGITNNHIYYLNYGKYNVYHKLQILNKTASSVTFRYAKIDGSGEITQTLAINPQTNYTYFSFKDNAIIDIEPADKNSWDIEFTRYTTLVTEFNDTKMYTVTGVINNPNKSIKIAQFDDVKLEDISFNQLLSANYSNYLGKIGYSWKKFSSASQDGFYSIPTRSYVVNIDNKYYGMQFTEYSKLVDNIMVKGYPMFLLRNF